MLRYVGPSQPAASDSTHHFFRAFLLCFQPVFLQFALKQRGESARESCMKAGETLRSRASLFLMGAEAKAAATAATTVRGTRLLLLPCSASTLRLPAGF